MNTFGVMQTIVPVLIGLVFCIIAGIWVARLLTWMKNNRSPEVEKNVRITQMRQQTRRSNHNGHPHSSTAYFVTFEEEDGRREEFRIRGSQYGKMAEGDTGVAWVQETRLNAFERK